MESSEMKDQTVHALFATVTTLQVLSSTHTSMHNLSNWLIFAIHYWRQNYSDIWKKSYGNIFRKLFVSPMFISTPCWKQYWNHPETYTKEECITILIRCYLVFLINKYQIICVCLLRTTLNRKNSLRHSIISTH